MSEGRYRILLVDDNPEDGLLVDDLLGEIRLWHADLVWAKRYDEALERLAGDHFDVALVEHRLGARNGLELIAEPAFRAAGVPVVAMTGQPSSDIDQAALAAGAVDCLLKTGLTSAALERSIRYAVENSRRHHNEARYRALVENSRDLITVLGPDGTIRYVSPSLSRILDRDPSEITGANALDEVHRDDQAEVRRVFEELARTPRGVRHLQVRVRHRDGSWRVLDTESQNLLDDVLVRGIIVNSWDVTELRRAQDALAETAGLLQQTLSSLEDAVFTVDMRTRAILRANDSTLAIFGYTAEELIGASTRLVHVDEAAFEAFGRTVDTVLQSSSRFHGQVTLRRRDGSTFAAEFTISPLRPAAGVDRGVVGVVRDLTQRIEEERQLQFQAELLRCVGQPVMAVDRDGRVTYWNKAFEDLTGWACGEVLGTAVLDRIVQPAAFGVDLRARMAALLDEHWTGELALIHKDGSTRTVSATVTPAVNPDGSAGGRIAAGVDITALRTTETERRVEAERAQFRARMLDAVGQAVIATDLAGNVTYWNRAAEQLYGWTAAEAIGRKVVELTPTDASGEQAAAIMAALQRGESWSGEFEAKRKAGERFPALVTDAPILDDAGQLVGIVGISSDLTERRELERQLRQAQKMEAIGRLAGGIAHDFNNLLTAINGHSSMLLEDLPDDSPFRDDIRQILNAGDRAAALTRQLLAFSRKQVLEERAVDVCKLISDMQRLLRRLIPERIDLLVAMDDIPIVARADPDQLGQVVMNLLVNAGDAIEGAGRISIRVAAIELTPDMASAIPWTVHAGPYAQLLVEDTGAGMHPELLTHIFDPFFTTKPAGKGTGLGLSTVFGIVKQSGGHVLVESELGRGSTFKVLLPLAQERPDEGIVHATPTAARPGGLVLLVEDEAAVRDLASRVLQRLGYRVLTAANGREALEIADAHGGRIDLVVTDVVMPELSGVELVDRLHERYPTIKVVLMSGYSEADLRGEVRTRGAFMVKPFTPDSLARVVADALSA